MVDRVLLVLFIVVVIRKFFYDKLVDFVQGDFLVWSIFDGYGD